jgi:hypothetical protein
VKKAIIFMGMIVGVVLSHVLQAEPKADYDAQMNDSE